MTANQNPFCFKELKDLKRQMTKLHGMFTINNKYYLSIGVDAKIVIGLVIFIIIVMGANPPYDCKALWVYNNKALYKYIIYSFIHSMGF